MKRIIFLLGVLIMSLTSPVSADSTTIYPAWEDWTSQSDPTNPGQSISNYGWVGTQLSPQGKGRLYVEFNTSSIPTGANITSATITLNDQGGSFSSSPRNWRIYYMSENMTNGAYDDDGAGPYITWNNPPDSCQADHYHDSTITQSGDDTIDITTLVRNMYLDNSTMRTLCGSNFNYSGLVIQDNVESDNNNYKNYYMQYNLGAKQSGVPYITVVYSIGAGNITNSSLDPQDPSPTYLTGSEAYDHCVEFAGDYNFPSYEIWWSETSNGSTKTDLLKTGSASAGDITCISFAPPYNFDTDYSIIFNATNSLGESYEEYVNYIYEGENSYWTINIQLLDESDNSSIEGGIIELAHGSFNIAGASQGLDDSSYNVVQQNTLFTGADGFAYVYVLPLATVYNIYLGADGYEIKLSNLVIDGSGTHTYYLTPSDYELNQTMYARNNSQAPTTENTILTVFDLIKILAPFMVLGFAYKALFG